MKFKPDLRQPPWPPEHPKLHWRRHSNHGPVCADVGRFKQIVDALAPIWTATALPALPEEADFRVIAHRAIVCQWS